MQENFLVAGASPGAAQRSPNPNQSINYLFAHKIQMFFHMTIQEQDKQGY